MNIGAAFPGKYLKSSDIPEGHTVTVRIDRVVMENVGQQGKQEMKPVVYFIGKERGMVMNKTNSNTISAAYGNETDDWHGKPVQIVSTETEFGGEMVSCLRVRIPRPAAAPAANGDAPAATLAERGQQVRQRREVESPIGDEQHFNPDDVPF